MEKSQVLERMRKLNEDEQFYREYFFAGKSKPKLRKFLSGLDMDKIKARHLVVPEIAPDIISYIMYDGEYFKPNDHKSVFISRHNRYTPAFVHKHEFFEIVYILEGQCTQNIGVQTLSFSAGDVCLIAPGVFHTMEVFDDKSVVFNILLRRSTFYQMFTPLTIGDNLLSEFFSEGLYSTNQIEYIIFHTQNAPFIYDSFLEMCGEQLERDEYTDQIMVGTLTKVTAEIMRYCKSTMESSFSRQASIQSDDFLVINYIQDHLPDVSLTDVANHFGFSVPYCSRLIKASTGQRFNDWKRTLRLRRAEHLLLNTNQTVAEISDTLGYANPESFIRIFKKAFNLSPSQYRKHSQK